MYLGKSKNEGFVLIEVIIILNIIIFLLVIMSKQTVSNIVKSNYYGIRDELRTLNTKEEALIKEVEEQINADETLATKLMDPIQIQNIIYIHKYTKDINLWLEIKEGKIYIINKLYDLKKYNEIIAKEVEIQGMKKIILIPTLYNSEYI